MYTVLPLGDIVNDVGNESVIIFHLNTYSVTAINTLEFLLNP